MCISVSAETWAFRQCISMELHLTASLVFALLLACFAPKESFSVPQFPAFFIFGDSLVDVGNNNYINTFARANSLPYGIDFPAGPTGRFCNGKIVTDILCEKLSLPFPPAYLAPTTRGEAILQGVNYASAAGGILRRSGYNFIGRVDLDTQLTWFANTVQELQQQLGASGAQDLLSKSLYSMTMGSNDFINNYILKGSPTPLQYTPAQFQQLLLSTFSAQLTQLYKLGARKTLVTSVGPIGCIPSQLARRSVNGECSDYVNSFALTFNEGLKSVISDLNSQLPGSQFLYAEVYDAIFAYRSNPQQYGFKYGAIACCGRGGKYKGLVICLPKSKSCVDRADYVFWDTFHPSEGANVLLGNLLLQQISSSFK